MMAGEEMESFLRQGLKSYPEAKAAVETYEQEIQHRLATLFETTDWTHFQPKRGERGRGKAVWTGADRSTEGRYVCAYQGSEAESIVELGLWWGSVRARDGVIMYCGFWQKGQLWSVQLTAPTPPIRCESINRNRARLFVVLDEQFDLESTGRALLADLDRALQGIPRIEPSEGG
jgi:hypothetical protein